MTYDTYLQRMHVVETQYLDLPPSIDQLKPRPQGAFNNVIEYIGVVCVFSQYNYVYYYDTLCLLL
jgi:hypothetical protein